MRKLPSGTNIRSLPLRSGNNYLGHEFNRPTRSGKQIAQRSKRFVRGNDIESTGVRGGQRLERAQLVPRVVSEVGIAGNAQTRLGSSTASRVAEVPNRADSDWSAIRCSRAMPQIGSPRLIITRFDAMTIAASGKPSAMNDAPRMRSGSRSKA